MPKRFYTQIDLCGNELLRAVLQNVVSTSLSGNQLTAGKIYYATDLNKPIYCDGTNVREIFYKGETLNPTTINQNGFDSTQKVLLVSAEDTTSWNSKQDGLGFTPENSANKNASDGYAGLDSSAKLSLSTLWDGMVVLSNDGSSLLTLGQILDQPGGVPTLNENGNLSPLKIEQTGFDSTARVLLVSEVERNLWNNVGNAGVEYQANKGAANGYAPLDATATIPKANIPEGTILKKIKRVEIVFDGTTAENDVFTYSIAGSPSRQFIIDATTTLVDLLTLVRDSINSNTPENANVIATHDSISKITILGLSAGLDYDYAFSYVNFIPGNLTITSTLVLAAYYDLSNIGGTSSFGFAPLNQNGIIERKYLPSIGDIVVLETYTDLLNYPIENVYNGLQVFVVDATDDTTNNPIGSAEYIWLDSVPGWRIVITETQIDLSHQLLQDLQGDGAGTGDLQHLTTVQLQKLKDGEYLANVAHFDATALSTLFIIPFTNSNGKKFRSVRIFISAEDHVNSNLVTTNLDLMWDGKRVKLLESNRSINNLDFQLEFATDYDVNNAYLLVVADSNDISFSARIAITEAVDQTLSRSLVPGNDLFPAPNLIIG